MTTQLTTPTDDRPRTDREVAPVRRVIAIMYGVRAADVPDAVVDAVVESDRVPVCWRCVESLLARVRPVHG
ncbi:MAG TPA: hypothetical protein VNP92_15710 [Actinophytocola sp.]|nr:hypothetical protein [Actinophytocola sp.]